MGANSKRLISSLFILWCSFNICTASNEATDDCSPVDYRTSPCLPATKNQSDTEWCYAYSASEIVSYQLCREISPAALGILKSEEASTPGHFWINGGWPDEAIELGNKNGFCLESELPSQLVNGNQAYALKIAYLALLEKSEQPKSGTVDCAKIDNLQFRKLFPQAEMADVVKFMVHGQDPNELYALAKKSCKNNIFVKIKVDQCSGDSNSKFEFVNKKLSQGPVSLAGMGFGSKLFANSTTGNFAHAVTLVGRERDSNSGECRYIINDSGGAYRVGGMKIGNEYQPYRSVAVSELLKDLSMDDIRCYSAHK